MLINRIKRKLTSKTNKALKTRWINKLKKRNKNTNVTIISNNCIAGVIYHNIGEQFCSPTINLYIKGEDYLTFVKNLKYFSKCSMIDITEEENLGFPVGRLISNDSNIKSVNVYFQHYNNFLEAKNAWDKRFLRINYENIYFIWEFFENLYDIELLYEFDNSSLNTISLIHNDIPNLKNSFKFDCYDKTDKPGKLLQFKNFSGKRYLDDWDYISWLNNKNN